MTGTTRSSAGLDARRRRILYRSWHRGTREMDLLMGRFADALIGEMSEQYGLGVANVFHAGDGNLHPLIMFDANDPASFRKAEEFGADILRLCVEVGGCLTGEHGVGVEKRDLMTAQFTARELDLQRAVKTAFDPQWLLNTAKVFPLTPSLAAE